MTREQAKQVLIVKAGYGDFVEDIIDQIFNDHEVQLKALTKANNEMLKRHKEAYDSLSEDFAKEVLLNKAKDEEIERLKTKNEELDKLGAEMFMIDLLHGKDYKARSIVAMLFWEWKKRKRLYIANGHRSGNAGWGLYEQTNLMEVMFKKSYKMLKDTKCY